MCRVVYMSVQDRRAQARDTALELLQSGVPIQDLTMRLIAKRQGTPLPTLTYAYQAVTDLLDDLLIAVEGPLFDSVGSRGLAVELNHFLNVSDSAGEADPAIEELSTYAITRTGKLGDRGLAAQRVAGTVAMITAIREKAGERYRLTDETIGRQFRLMFEGAYLHWVDAGGPEPKNKALRNEEWRAWIREGIEVIVLAADPKPIRARGRSTPARPAAGKRRS